MDDSGYDSPRKGVTMKRVKFKLKYSNNMAMARYISPTVIDAEPNETIAAAITMYHSKRAVDKRLFWAQVKGCGEVSINPFSLLCEFLVPESDVVMEKNNGIDYVKDTDVVGEQRRCVFSITTDDRYGLEGITNIDYRCFGGKPICVVATEKQTFEGAIRNDGRFKNIARFELLYGLDRTKLASLHKQKPIDFENTVFSIRVRRSTIQPNVEKREDAGTEESGIEPDEIGSYNFSKKAVWTNEERLQEMQNVARKAAELTLVPRDKRRRFEKELKRVIKTELAIRSNTSRSAEFSNHVVRIYPSVGQIICGDVCATCFLVTEDMVVTNNHVVDEILLAQHSSDPSTHAKIFVDFDYDSAEKHGTPVECCKISDGRNIRDSALDYAFLFLKQRVSGKTPLGDRVRTNTPDYGKVVIIGHPERHHKLDDLCIIIPKDGMREEMSKRVAKEEGRCREKPQECNSINQTVNCIHLYNPLQNVSERETNILAYDSSNMFKGTSGSPVVNMSGHIVAIHSVGFLLDENDKKTSLLEYGFTFKAIIDDLIQKGLDEFVRMCFPFYDTEPMDEC